MDLKEFKAWFEGFTDGMDGPPTKKQWEKIQARVKEITSEPTVREVFIERYWPTRTWYSTPSLGFYSGTSATITATGGTAEYIPFNSVSAYYSLGKEDRETLGS